MITARQDEEKRSLPALRTVDAPAVRPTNTDLKSPYELTVGNIMSLEGLPLSCSYDITVSAKLQAKDTSSSNCRPRWTSLITINANWSCTPFGFDPGGSAPDSPSPDTAALSANMSIVFARPSNFASSIEISCADLSLVAGTALTPDNSFTKPTQSVSWRTSLRTLSRPASSREANMLRTLRMATASSMTATPVAMVSMLSLANTWCPHSESTKLTELRLLILALRSLVPVAAAALAEKRWHDINAVPKESSYSDTIT